MKSILISGKTHPGRRRSENQDACISRRLWTADKALLAVIDGVGGYTGGEKAAAIAKDCIEQYMQIPRGDTLTMLREAVVFANNQIVEERKKDQYTSEMCCVLTAVVADVAAKSVYFAHVGDTRLYRYRNGGLQKITKDHSFVGIKEDAGDITEQEAMAHPHRNQILREVGSTVHRLDDEDFMDYGREDLLPGDLLLLCSDGLTDMITVQQMTTLLSASHSLTGKVNNLIALANEMGGYDNITVVLLQHQLPAVKIQNKPQAPVIAESVEIVVPETVPQQKTPTKKRRLLWAMLVLLLLAGAGWYLSFVNGRIVSRPTENTTLPSTIVQKLPVDTIVMDSNKVLSTRGIHPAVPGPVVEKTDTLRLSATQNLADLEHYADSTGRILVLVPEKNTRKRFAAVEITARSAKPGDTLLVKNLRLKDFETGINVRIPVLLKTENLAFENIRYPFSYPAKNDNRNTPVLFTNTAKQ
jgi:PPM family protein phosphatase